MIKIISIFLAVALFFTGIVYGAHLRVPMGGGEERVLSGCEGARNSKADELFGIDNDMKELLLEESIRKEIRLLFMHELGEQFSVEVQNVSI